MTETPKLVGDSQRMALTQAELTLLQDLMKVGDRAGFYLAYYAMTGSSEALLTAKIATFSETVGGVAFAANWLAQDANRPGYQGIYALSQDVAQNAWFAIDADLRGEERDRRERDQFADGNVIDNRLFVSSFDAWLNAGNQALFPGNFLIGQSGFAQFFTGDFSVADWSAATARKAVNLGGTKRMFQALFASLELQCSQNSNQHALNLIKRDVIASPVIELGGAGAGMVRHGGGTL